MERAAELQSTDEPGCGGPSIKSLRPIRAAIGSPWPVVPVRFSSAILYAAALALDADPEPIGGPGGGGGYLGAACKIGGGFPTADDLGEAFGGV